MSFIISWIGDAIAPTITSIVETGGVKVAEGIDYVANTVDGVGNKVTGGNWLFLRLVITFGSLTVLPCSCRFHRRSYGGQDLDLWR